ncbi:type IX secretion system protein PorD [Natronoflexus pectinivorans]|uniref:Uncharacterized protein DUF4835 n=1 Tax=Natronoflexus pectinivorans TaxID=682526 RepID=A0A4R2GK85_9BACT|nr:DUF4835 family protein [Natronoflexus pectinivorans]TCO08885.1 uncharacterized protein DUF4835 [Natronoflexus pectinivorans]
MVKHNFKYLFRAALMVLLMFIISYPLAAQELRARVQVVAPGVQGTNRAVFETLQTSIMEFLNGQQWTEHKFNPEERIDCTILINIREVIGSDEFRGTIQIQARRPVYNSSYNTPLLNYLDQNLHFRYIEYETLVYNPSNIESNLVAILAYYAYIVLGFDYDSFSQRGGTPYFQRAEQIVNMMQNARESGWRSFESQRNRYWLVENLLNEHHTPLRNAFYQYHRRGLDMMADRVDEGRSNIASSLELLQRVHRQRPNSFALGFFFDAKSEELVNIFSNSPSMERGRVVNLLSEVDPTNSDKYQQILSERGRM